jgi:C4-dicarboxylate transporter DctQ subunit
MLAVRLWLQRRADDVAVGLLTAMFLAFVLQITARYVFNYPLTWTLELCLTTWLWTVFWGAAFCLKNDEHVRFDMLYCAVNANWRRWFAGVGALAVVVGLVMSVPGSWSFVSFLSIKKSATLRIPLVYIFSIYMVFVVATVLAYGFRLRQALRHEIDQLHVEHPSS